MTKLTWNDSPGSRIYRYGVDRGVLYTGSMNYGVAWNGLIRVTSKNNGGAPNPYYIDGFKYYNEPVQTDHSSTIEAFTYPDEFGPCIGESYNEAGLGFDNQINEPFGLSYRTKIGNDVDGLDHGYQIHLVYNAIATMSDNDYTTTSEDPSILTFSWDIYTTPVSIPGMSPTAHFILDSRKIKKDSLNNLESILYGSPGLNPRLPSASELVTILNDWLGFQITPRTSGLALLQPSGIDDLVGDKSDGLLKKAPDSRLRETTLGSGLYRLV